MAFRRLGIPARRSKSGTSSRRIEVLDRAGGEQVSVFATTGDVDLLSPACDLTRNPKAVFPATAAVDLLGSADRLERTPTTVFSANAEIQERADANRRAPLDSRIRGKDAVGQQYYVVRFFLSRNTKSTAPNAGIQERESLNLRTPLDSRIRGKDALGHLHRRTYCAPGVRAILFALVAVLSLSGFATTHPNIIYILADDLGYGDLRCLNPESKIPTPHMDRLAAEGMTFTDAHSGSAVCTPTRYGILTGRYAWRTRLKSGVLWGYSPPLIDHGELTVAQYLKDQGYHTACVGKWHLGLGWQTTDGSMLNDEVKLTGEKVDFAKPVTHGPLDLGFDYFFGISASLDMPPYVYIENDRATAIPTEMKPTTFRTGLTADGFETVDVLPDLTEKAVDYLKQRHTEAPDQPFFLYFPLTAPHTPVVPAPFVEGWSEAGEYGDFTAQVDYTVGEVLKALDELGISDNTLVVMTSDNGSTEPTAKMVKEFGHRPNYHFRGRKSDVWEGGHHVPFLVRWPARVKAGAKTGEVTCLTDLLATAADIIGAPLSEGAGEDSTSMLPALLGEQRDGPLRDHTIHHSINGIFALRQGPWKFIDAPGSGGWSSNGKNAPKPDAPPVQLYNLDDDIGEENNVWGAEQEKVEAMKAMLEQVKRDEQ